MLGNRYRNEKHGDYQEMNGQERACFCASTLHHRGSAGCQGGAGDDFRIPTAQRRQPPATVAACRSSAPRAPLLAVAKAKGGSKPLFIFIPRLAILFIEAVHGNPKVPCCVIAVGNNLDDKKLVDAPDNWQIKQRILTRATFIPLPPNSDGQVKIGPLSVSPMGFGTWAWGNQLLWGYQESMDNELQECFNLALRNGINLFDTADSYGTGRLNGQSERLLGKFIREFEGPIKSPDDVVIATKFAAYPWRLTSGQFVSACKSSLERLQLDRLGIGQLHWSTANYAPLQERALWDGLVEMYEKGLVRAVGVSNYGPKQLLKIHSYLSSRGVPLISAQVQFSLLSMGDEQMELKTVCDSLGIRLIAYSPLGLGMLTGKYDASNLPTGPRSLLFRQFLPGLESLLTCLRSTAERKGKTMSQVAINWCICKGTVPIPGVKTVRHVEENLGALGWRLSPTEISELEAAAMESPKKMIQNIFQTA